MPSAPVPVVPSTGCDAVAIAGACPTGSNGRWASPLGIWRREGVVASGNALAGGLVGHFADRLGLEEAKGQREVKGEIAD